MWALQGKVSRMWIQEVDNGMNMLNAIFVVIICCGIIALAMPVFDWLYKMMRRHIFKMRDKDAK